VQGAKEVGKINPPFFALCSTPSAKDGNLVVKASARLYQVGVCAGSCVEKRGCLLYGELKPRSELGGQRARSKRH